MPPVDLAVRLGAGLLDECLEFLAGRCRPNTVLAAAYDLKVFFTAVGKPPRRVCPVDVLAFMTASGPRARRAAAGVPVSAAAAACRPYRRSPQRPSGPVPGHPAKPTHPRPLPARKQILVNRNLVS